MPAKNLDIHFLKIALALAKKGLNWTWPNPLVGALIVKNGKVIGQGYHHKFGGLHAEVNALRSAKSSVKGATLYVTLEPCSHWGKTPPCVEAIINAGISRVVCCTKDSNPQVSGHGLQLLKKAGIAVMVGLLESEARLLNEAFFTFHERKRPFVALKFAASLDGKIATTTGDSQWITNAAARGYARSLRANYQAILVGANTVLADNPHLGLRQKKFSDPLRVILDGQLKTSPQAKVYRDSNVIVATTASNPKKIVKFKQPGIETLVFPGQQVPLKRLLVVLAKRGVISILVEGGSQTLGAFLDERLVDKVYAFQAPILIGGKDSLSAFGGRGVKAIKQALKLERVNFKKFGDNTLTVGYVKP
ncbi:MAG: riboflavin biosynthesis protein RibD [Candidatus Buchananbacteria bacterium RIFCSPHIGHO2_01_FULL_44_11]|uniref:Riboflavin biosynthesis protein RibD n=1 Tax=Candidatus Buchananbacteria bacterium RIFCSPHIGHO2_01_FULL_44_11 TaxID=1797535 RepID=A0A1G1Y576_9BACT|nr:MAG: riboflavin biosynthesis protein RibD [Candidatus Buchananbacteria bacterium RIFCSPHIGHO2_01_FULL_44_11]